MMGLLNQVALVRAERTRLFLWDIAMAVVAGGSSGFCETSL